jgi:tetratricopeptide (TPR) repeat protein
MALIRMQFQCLLAGALIVSAGLEAKSQTLQDVPKQVGLRQSVSATPQDGNFEKATQLMQQGKNDEALALLEGIVAAEPGRHGVMRQIGIANYRKGDFLKAAASFQKALEDDPKDNEAIQLLGLSYYLAGRPAEAIPALEKVQTWYPSANVDAAYILGVCYIQTKDYPAARRAFAKMFGVTGDSAASYVVTARMLLRQDFAPVAEEYARKAVEIDPKLPLAHSLLGEIYLYKSRFPEAIEQFQKELELNPADAAAYYKLADAYSRVQKFEEAERLLQRSIWLDATSTGPYILLGKVLEKKGETALAVRALQRALAMDPNNPIPHHLLGQAYRELGQTEEADRELKLSEQLQNRQNAKP